MAVDIPAPITPKPKLVTNIKLITILTKAPIEVDISDILLLPTEYIIFDINNVMLKKTLPSIINLKYCFAKGNIASLAPKNISIFSLNKRTLTIIIVITKYDAVKPLISTFLDSSKFFSPLLLEKAVEVPIAIIDAIAYTILCIGKTRTKAAIPDDPTSLPTNIVSIIPYNSVIKYANMIGIENLNNSFPIFSSPNNFALLIIKPPFKCSQWLLTNKGKPLKELSMVT